MAKANTNAADRPQRRVIVGYSLLLAALVGCGLYVILISGPAVRHAAHDYLVRTIAEEDRQFCETFGVRAASSSFAACSSELAIIRKKQVDRNNAAAQGIF